MAKTAFGCEPLVFSLPYRSEVKASSPTEFSVIIVDCSNRIPNAFARHPDFWLNTVPTANLGADGFELNVDVLPQSERAAWQRIAPTALIQDEGAPLLTDDDWPFPYLQGRLVPELSIRSIFLMGGLGLGMVYLFLPKGRIQFNSRMFFLGAAFMLLETRAVVQLALLFGSTWIVNSLVFFTVLVFILLANLYVIKFPSAGTGRHYSGLLIVLAIAVTIPLQIFLEGGVLWRYVMPCMLALGPMFFAGVIFARSFRDASDPDQALGFNIAGAIVGGLSESLSMLVGFRYLLLVAILFYLLSIYVPNLRDRVPLRAEGAGRTPKSSGS